jgi:hypothetical protein
MLFNGAFRDFFDGKDPPGGLMDGLIDNPKSSFSNNFDKNEVMDLCLIFLLFIVFLFGGVFYGVVVIDGC